MSRMATPGSLLPGSFVLGRLSHADRVGLVYRAHHAENRDARPASALVLTEISDVSNSLAGLIEQISSDTQSQAEIATTVATSMEDILRITDRTTTGTQQTAESIGELADLAVELKGSVAGFKV